MAVPVYHSSGTGSNVAGTVNPTPSWPATIVSGAIAFMSASVRNDATRTMAAPSGWALVNDSGYFSSGSDQRYYVFVYGTVANPTPLIGSESGTVTVTCSGGTAGRNAAIIHQFTGSNSSWRIEDIDAEIKNTYDTAFSDNNVTTSGSDRLAINLVCSPTNQNTALVIPTNMTGGTWVLRSDYILNNPSLHLMTADMPSAGIIGNGTSTLALAGVTCVIGFAIHNIVPVYHSSGTGSNVDAPTVGNPTPSWPTTIVPGAIAIMQASVRNDATRTMAAPSGWALVNDSGYFGGSLNQRSYVFVYGTVANPTPLTGSESGTVTVTCSGGTAGRNAAIIHQITGAYNIWHFENVDVEIKNAYDNAFSDNDVTTTAPGRLAVNLVCSSSNQNGALVIPTNMTGGTWVLRSNFAVNNPSFHMMTADMNATGTVGSGTSTLAVAGVIAVCGFALYTTAPGGLAPNTGAVSIAGIVPTLTRTIQAVVGPVGIVGHAPSLNVISVPIFVNPSAGAEVWTEGNPPTITIVIPSTGIEEMSAQETGTAWLVLLTMSHPDLVQPIRVTSDGVSTTSNGNIFSPFPFELVLPDDAEGRAPRAQIRIDNTSQEIIAALRGLTSPASLTVQIVRSLSPNIIERQWVGLEWRHSQYDIGTITGSLTVDDIATEEFPFVTFDGRFPGLFP